MKKTTAAAQTGAALLSLFSAVGSVSIWAAASSAPTVIAARDGPPELIGGLRTMQAAVIMLESNWGAEEIGLQAISTLIIT